MPSVSRIRQHLLRAGYLLLVVGLGVEMWPQLLRHGSDLELMHSAELCMLCALSLLSVLGLRFPLKMLPLLFFELTWKALWLLRVALPRWRHHQLDDDFRATVFACLLAGLFIPLIPWRYAARSYLLGTGETSTSGHR